MGPGDSGAMNEGEMIQYLDAKFGAVHDRITALVRETVESKTWLMEVTKRLHDHEETIYGDEKRGGLVADVHLLNTSRAILTWSLATVAFSVITVGMAAVFAFQG